MPLRHLVLLNFTPETTIDDVTDITEALRTLPALIPELVAYHVGPNLGIADGTWDYGIAADFADQDDWATYRDHPDHVRIIHDLIAPHVRERAAVQYDLAFATGPTIRDES